MNLPATPDTAEEPDYSGRRFGDYQLLRRLGRGGMAEVYLAEQQSLRRKVAFKVLRGNLSRDDNYIRRFRNEAQAVAALVHANIVQVHEVGCLDGVHFMAQEYVPGQNLRQVLTRSGPMDVRLTVHIMRQVAAALHKAGQHGIVHRDIKPENILLAQTGEVKVADFGLARVTNDGGAMNLTQVGVTMGTPMYMSPEQVEGRTVDPRSDLYSFGVTCYQMLAGRPPFDGDTPLSVALQHLKKEPERLEQLRPSLPGGLCRIVHKLLAKQPENRYQNAADLLRDLRALQIEGVDEAWPSALDEWNTPELLALHTARVAATRQLDGLMKTQALQLRRRSRAWLWLAVIAAGFAVGSGGAWLVRPRPLLSRDNRDLPPVEKKDSVQDQYLFALNAGTEQALRSVERLFPPADNPMNDRYAHLAQQRLAELYSNEDRFDAAFAIYEQLARLDDSESQFKASGLIGQANILLHRGNLAAAKQKLVALRPYFDQLESRNALYQQLDPKLRPELQRLREETRPPANTPPSSAPVQPLKKPATKPPNKKSPLTQNPTAQSRVEHGVAGS